MPVTSIKAAARSCPYFTLLIALGLGPCSAGALASSDITKRIHSFDVGFSGNRTYPAIAQTNKVG